MIQESVQIGGRELKIEIGHLAKQSDGSALVKYGETVVLITVVYNKSPLEEYIDFVPLTVDYRELYAAAGKIPGGFFKREGRPREKEILVSRLIDRSIRPLFPEGFNHEVQVIGLLLSSDQENEADVLGIIGASVALSVSEIPFAGPVGALRMGYINNELVINPTISQLEKSKLNLVIAGTQEGVVMLEGNAEELTCEEIRDAIEKGHKEISKIVDFIKNIQVKIGKRKITYFKEEPEELIKEIEKRAAPEISEINRIKTKLERNNAMRELEKRVVEELSKVYPDCEPVVKATLDRLAKKDMRRKILKEGIRIDGRTPDDLRPVSCAIGILPRTHGSALFTRGETQCLAVTTLGTKSDEQLIDDVEREATKSFMLHYNFPPFSTNEVKPLKGPSRREIGHGALAERSLLAVIPKEEVFPYTIRVISNILESNGSSSMATVCGASLSLMDAGIPIKKPVAGVAMGLIKEGEKEVILTDIIGAEDHYGDMDFKIAGTRDGITGIQLDLKIPSVSFDTLYLAMRKATEVRLQILDIMAKTISSPRTEISKYAPRIIVFPIPKEKIGEVIGPGGRVIRKIIDATNTTIEIDDKSGEVLISGPDYDSVEKAKNMIEGITQEVEIGKIYKGKITKVANFGIFVEILPGKEGLVHISQLKNISKTERLQEKFKPGDTLLVKVMNIDELGRVSLTTKLSSDDKTKPYRKRTSFRSKDNI